MTPAEELAAKVSALLPIRGAGPLQIWGQSFGRPGEELGGAKDCYANGDCIRFDFGSDVVLAIWNPTDVEFGEKAIRIGSVSAIRLSSYRRHPKIPENISYRDFAFVDGSVAFRTNDEIGLGTGWLKQEMVNSRPAILI